MNAPYAIFWSCSDGVRGPVPGTATFDTKEAAEREAARLHAAKPFINYLARLRWNIKTEFVYPPIPIRKFDWSATLDGYDPGEPDEGGTYHGGDPIGHGATEAEAIDELTALLEDA